MLDIEKFEFLRPFTADVHPCNLAVTGLDQMLIFSQLLTVTEHTVEIAQYMDSQFVASRLASGANVFTSRNVQRLPLYSTV